MKRIAVLAAMMGALLLVFGLSGRGALEAPPSAEATETTTVFMYGNNPDGSIGPIAANDGASEVLLALSISPWCTDCYITRIVPDMVYWNDPNPLLTNGTPANYNADTGQGIWLHHDNIVSNCIPGTIFLSGNERTVYQAPVGYGSYIGVPFTADDPAGCNVQWFVGWHIHNSGGQPHKVAVKFTVTYRTGETLNRLKGVGLNIATATDAEYIAPVGYSDTHTCPSNCGTGINTDYTITAAQQGQVIAGGGHVHDYGFGVSAFNVTRNQWICTSTAGYGFIGSTQSLYRPTGGPGTPGHPAAGISQTIDHDYHLPDTPDDRFHIQSMSPCSVGGAGSVLCTGDVIRVHASYNKPQLSPPVGPIADAMGILSLALPANPPDADGDLTWDGCDTSDSDGDQFSDRIEGTAGTLANDACGANAWPPDINSNGSVGVIDDLAAVASDAFKSVPPAPARHDIAPDPPNGTIGVIDDLSRIASLAFGTCTP